MFWFVGNLAGAKDSGALLRLPDICMQFVMETETYIFAKFVMHASMR